jgi:DNA polymerase III alpha subunit (gram-positive type)
MLTTARTSEMVPQKELCKTIEAIFFEFSDKTFEGKEAIPGKQKRNIILVGHDVQADMQYLRGMGVDLMAADNFVKTIDTKDLHQHWSKAGQGRGLGYVLDDLGLQNKNLHNAGNDAAYTLQAMVGLAVSAAANRGRQVHDVKW